MSGEKRILDSGNRREFDSGAVRDIAEGKGRCDLLPLDMVGYFLSRCAVAEDDTELSDKYNVVGEVLVKLNAFIREGTIHNVYTAILHFVNHSYHSVVDALIEVSKHYEEGAKKYAERNWEKGIPAHCYVDSGVRHLLKWLDNWNDEPHDRAFIWNMLGLLWTVDHKPECNDLLYAKQKVESGSDFNNTKEDE